MPADWEPTGRSASGLSDTRADVAGFSGSVFPAETMIRQLMDFLRVAVELAPPWASGEPKCRCWRMQWRAL
jgi:hypothetical protein